MKYTVYTEIQVSSLQVIIIHGDIPGETYNEIPA